MKLSLSILAVTLFIGNFGCESCGDPFNMGDEIYHEISRVYSPDKTKYIIAYQFGYAGLTGVPYTTVLNAGDSINHRRQLRFSRFDFDTMYWENNDTITIKLNYIDFISKQYLSLSDTTWNGVTFHVVNHDPIDSSYERLMLYQAISPNGQFKLSAFRYVKPSKDYHVTNISVTGKDESLSKFGNFFVSHENYDWIRDVRWNSTNGLDIRGPLAFHSDFESYLRARRPAIKLNLIQDDTIIGNLITSINE